MSAVTPSNEATDDCSLAAFEAEIHVPAPAAMQTLPDAALTLGTANRAAGTVFACRDRCDPARLGTRSMEAPYLEHRIAVGEDHPARARYLVRLLGRTKDGFIEEGRWWSLDAVTEPTVTADGMLVAEDMQHGGVTFPRAQSEYCAAIELLDVVTDTSEIVDAGCLPHALPSEPRQTEPAFGTCEGFESGTMAQYVEAFCGDNAQDCAGGDERCDQWRKQCTPQSDPADAGPPASDDSGQPSPAQSKDASAQPEGPDDEPNDEPDEGPDTPDGVDAPDDEVDEAPDDGTESDASTGAPAEPPPPSASCRIDIATAGTTARWPLLLLAACLGAVPSSRSRRISRRLSASFSARMLNIGKAMPPLLAKNLTKTRRKLLGPGN